MLNYFYVQAYFAVVVFSYHLTLKESGQVTERGSPHRQVKWANVCRKI